MSDYEPLPSEALAICRATSASPRLIAHLTIVHDVAVKLVSALHNAFPSIAFNHNDVLFGAATHDIGKVSHPAELSEPGKLHEKRGRELLEQHGVSKHRARFAFSHGNWDGDNQIQLEDLIVALADNCWKGKRVAELEERIVKELAQMTKKPVWEVFATLDDVVQVLAAEADQRLAWQREFPLV